MQSDAELLAEYVDRQSEAAFTQLVERHVALVHSAALRQVGEPHLAQEITQAVFIILARKARSLVGHAVLAGWLCRTAHLAALDALKQQRRRQQREHNAYLESAMNEISADTEAAWQQLAPVLDEAVAQLRDHDRAALILRYYEQRPMEEVGAALGVGPDAAQKRVTRALEKLRQLFAKRGVKVTVAVIVAAISAHAVQAVPASLAGSVSAAVLASGSAAAGASTLTLVKGTLTAMAWGQYKALIGYGAAALAVGTAVIVTTLPPKPTTPPASSAVRTNQVAVIREPLTDSMKFMLESPPGGLALQPDGKIIVGTTLFGRFVDDTNGSLGFYTRGALRLNADGTLDRTFRCDVTPPGAAPQMAHVDVLPDGRIFLSGLFGTVDGEARPNYALLHPDGTVDESFQPWRGETNAPAPFFLPKIDSPHIWGLTSYQGGAIPAAWLADNSVALVCQSVETTNFPYTVLTAYRLDSSGRWIKPVSNRLSSDIFRPSGLIDTLAHVGFSARVSVDWERNTPAAWRCPWAPSAKSPFVLPRENSPLGSLAFQCFTEPPAAVDAAKVLRALFEEMPIELCRYAVRLPDGGAILAVRDKENTGMTAPGRFMRFDKDWLPDFSFTNEFVFDLGTCPAIKMQADGK
ncbi:MAG TPA: sigma-70 family RNA polymerase sigma factor, partial [Verrucomicrobiae bacterium]